eukprot:CAMPEP_0204405360 /NCGR_PEP_ID=MMETSP0470-20130426/7300_1 /ASSEMBLY_ACC=CAM_ASM_000385 /TAXON_ID=2969 /ORGANISM="Oxyrrhis marina" /LENGTH=55 /DNA_ID=CAMNT_0051400785 /DNA_START=258 /DNA_END=425 /DNA_ORIENTATION=-
MEQRNMGCNGRVVKDFALTLKRASMPMLREHKTNTSTCRSDNDAFAKALLWASLA